MDIEELKKRMKETQDKMQNEFIDKVYDELKHLNEKASRKDYEPTEHEKEVFGNIATIIAYMMKWF